MTPLDAWGCRLIAKSLKDGFERIRDSHPIGDLIPVTALGDDVANKTTCGLARFEWLFIGQPMEWKCLDAG
jgi:hypothetical protein